MCVACAGGEQLQMPPEEVLQNAVEESRKLQSAVFEGTARFVMGNWNGNADLEGVLQQGGRALKVGIDLDAVTESEGTEHSVQAEGTLIVMEADTVYVLLDELQSQPVHPLLPEAARSALLGAWWELPHRGTMSGDTVPVTPDPGMLQAQVEVVRIVRDRGMATVSGNSVRHLEVEVDTEKLIAFLRQATQEASEPFNEEEIRGEVEAMSIEGELWIDTASFVVRQVSWHIVRSQEGDTAESALDIECTVRLDKHNKAPDIVPPADAQPLTPLAFFGAQDSALLQDVLQQHGEDGTQVSDPLEQEALLRELLESGELPIPPYQ